MTENKTRRPRRTYTDEFKNQLVQLHLNGKRKCDIIREYDISGVLLDKWIKQSTTTGAFREKDNRSEMEQDKLEWQVSRRRIGRIMKQEGLVSNYTVAQYKSHVDKCNESQIANGVNRQFKNQPEYNVVVSDLTYVRFGMIWNYICVLVDLFNREIIGYSAGRNKDEILVSKAFSKVKVNLNHIKIFHTDRGNEFKNKLIDETLESFQIQRSLR